VKIEILSIEPFQQQQAAAGTKYMVKPFIILLKNQHVT
jgi:hypothetical protein